MAIRVLSNGAGGMSGKAVLPIALKCIREIRAVCDLPIIGCGGISGAATMFVKPKDAVAQMLSVMGSALHRVDHRRDGAIIFCTSLRIGY